MIGAALPSHKKSCKKSSRTGDYRVGGRPMPTLHRTVQQLRQLALLQAEQGTDADLLRNFIRHQDEHAFETLVRRHGPLVLRVCRRLLKNAHDAEDAFQATFLVLIRKARSIRKTQSLASWLHGVAHRVSLTA